MTITMTRIARPVQNYSLTEPSPPFQSFEKRSGPLPARSLSRKRHAATIIGLRRVAGHAFELNLHNVEAGIQRLHSAGEHCTARPEDDGANPVPRRQATLAHTPFLIRAPVV